MKRTAALLLALCLICSCLAACSSEKKTISPLPFNLSTDALQDVTVSAEFTEADLKDGSLSFRVYAEVLFDAVDVSRLEKGDFIETAEGEKLKISSIDRTDGGTVELNGGAEKGGISLSSGDGGTFRQVAAFDDYSVMHFIGDASAPLSGNVKLTDDSDPDNQGVEVTASELAAYVSDSVIGFNRLNTRLLIENGEITEIHRIYTP